MACVASSTNTPSCCTAGNKTKPQLSQNPPSWRPVQPPCRPPAPASADALHRQRWECGGRRRGSNKTGERQGKGDRWERGKSWWHLSQPAHSAAHSLPSAPCCAATASKQRPTKFQSAHHHNTVLPLSPACLSFLSPALLLRGSSLSPGTPALLEGSTKAGQRVKPQFMFSLFITLSTKSMASVLLRATCFCEVVVE